MTVSVQSTDPDLPGYRTSPDAADAATTGGYGSGRDFGADVFALYRAGRVYFPDVATLYSAWTTSTHDFAQRTAFLDEAVGGRAALALVEDTRATLQGALRHTAITMAEVGEALVATAADFAATDEAAGAEFDRLARLQRGLLDEPTATVPRPPGAGAP